MLLALSFIMRSKFAELRSMIGVKKIPILRRRKALVLMKRIWSSEIVLPRYLEKKENLLTIHLSIVGVLILRSYLPSHIII